jgi:AcrR family transcriptional regulator
MAEAHRPSTKRYVKGEQTRDQILATAKKLFTQRGYHNTSVYDLFRTARITKGAFYHHWKAKEDLAFTILDELVRAYEKQVFPILMGKGRARHLIERTLNTLSDLNSNPNWLYCRLMATWSSELEPGDDALGSAVHEVRDRWVLAWEQVLERAQWERDLRIDISAKDLSFLVVSTISGVYLMHGKGLDSNGQRRAIETLKKLIFAR